jgi:hypothetical protein
VTPQVIRLHDNLPKKPLDQLGLIGCIAGFFNWIRETPNDS